MDQASDTAVQELRTLSRLFDIGSSTPKWRLGERDVLSCLLFGGTQLNQHSKQQLGRTQWLESQPSGGPANSSRLTDGNMQRSLKILQQWKFVDTLPGYLTVLISVWRWVFLLPFTKPTQSVQVTPTALQHEITTPEQNVCSPTITVVSPSAINTMTSSRQGTSPQDPQKPPSSSERKLAVQVIESTEIPATIMTHPFSPTLSTSPVGQGNYQTVPLSNETAELVQRSATVGTEKDSDEATPPRAISLRRSNRFTSRKPPKFNSRMLLAGFPALSNCDRWKRVISWRTAAIYFLWLTFVGISGFVLFSGVSGMTASIDISLLTLIIILFTICSVLYNGICARRLLTTSVQQIDSVIEVTSRVCVGLSHTRANTAVHIFGLAGAFSRRASESDSTRVRARQAALERHTRLSLSETFSRAARSYLINVILYTASFAGIQVTIFPTLYGSNSWALTTVMPLLSFILGLWGAVLPAVTTVLLSSLKQQTSAVSDFAELYHNQFASHPAKAQLLRVSVQLLQASCRIVDGVLRAFIMPAYVAKLVLAFLCAVVLFFQPLLTAALGAQVTHVNDTKSDANKSTRELVALGLAAAILCVISFAQLYDAAHTNKRLQLLCARLQRMCSAALSITLLPNDASPHTRLQEDAFCRLLDEANIDHASLRPNATGGLPVFRDFSPREAQSALATQSLSRRQHADPSLSLDTSWRPDSPTRVHLSPQAAGRRVPGITESHLRFQRPDSSTVAHTAKLELHRLYLLLLGCNAGGLHSDLCLHMTSDTVITERLLLKAVIGAISISGFLLRLNDAL